ncbi:MarR family winged helix-turn-helix transcriptional regulator [Micromonospora sp. NBC_01813]|uniref:MarR family winged helix-turn-helix transcriptional regulator n=1 Tax=Micromonospora sp. NBC_01813 TaxID=2975988 RepID=UPI002DD7B5B2|nr:MarR family transcriptional regulator [Micromonospora sp. NBC_01813]WSA12087.1 MarR family transcriptional regulator [Micromonospora sp. NBC_01813]
MTPANAMDSRADDSAAAPGDELLVLWELVQTAHLATRVFRDVFADFGLTSTQFGVLACLADGDDFTKAELARALLVRPQSIDPLIETLIAERLVERDGPARRGRAAGITITTAGTELLARIRPRVSEVNSPDRIGVDASQIPLLVEQLRMIRDRLA